MIDLHTHSTASDGMFAPEALVARAAAAGVKTLGLTDHDTIAGCAAASAACGKMGLTFVPGIEITAMTGDRDVHVLAYFFDLESSALRSFLVAQREIRVNRVRAIFDRLKTLGMPLDVEAILRPGLENPSVSVGRPWIARALVAAGYVSSVNDAFERWLGRGCPAFVPRGGASTADVFAVVHEAGGLVSLAHPVLVKHDEWIPGFARQGLDAIEAFHSAQTFDDTRRYQLIARDLGLLLTGGSDFHGTEHGGGGPGSVTLPRGEFERLLEWRARHSN
ncbi:MAG: PHP domain-containing protein [Vicinamibacterales bacterium]